MSTILVHKGKHCDTHIFVEKGNEGAGWIAMFRFLDEVEGFYQDLEGDELDLYNKAKDGDARSAKWLIECRSRHEYEEVREEVAYLPQDVLAWLEKKKNAA